MRKTLSAACVATLLGTVAAHAAPVTLTQSGTLTSNGQDFIFDFLALPTVVSSASVTIASSISGGTEGLDLSGSFSRENEFFSLTFDGAAGGSFSCGGPSSNGSTAIPGATDNSRAFNDCVFSLDVVLTDLSVFADGAFSLGVNFGNDVSTFNQNDQFTATLTYDNVAAVPLPASVGFMLLGLAGLGTVAARRRRG
ncbi:VPLPA-CTERM sorting domain-containing protein [Jannaschia sp. CCS1]|uniref:VPLPA-CTERM sorting domain-containing protein n=1 Tax=Jannaschia sp. (strain CCS1) TaxID=290400 RepID=UPI000053CFCD|nr:VPLPA-CTERM sorting domain-containing protein [Jannaschia sp. CCS1]ABD54050.1 hypothetical protein Jann_1133 [Jannaschia sp. CCS1]